MAAMSTVRAKAGDLGDIVDSREISEKRKKAQAAALPGGGGAPEAMFTPPATQQSGLVGLRWFVFYRRGKLPHCGRRDFTHHGDPEVRDAAYHDLRGTQRGDAFAAHALLGNRLDEN